MSNMLSRTNLWKYLWFSLISCGCHKYKNICNIDNNLYYSLSYFLHCVPNFWEYCSKYLLPILQCSPLHDYLLDCHYCSSRKGWWWYWVCWGCWWYWGWCRCCCWNYWRRRLSLNSYNKREYLLPSLPQPSLVQRPLWSTNPCRNSSGHTAKVCPGLVQGISSNHYSSLTQYLQNPKLSPHLSFISNSKTSPVLQEIKEVSAGITIV